MNDTRFLRSKLHNNFNSLDDNYKTGPAYRFSSLDAFSIHESQRANSYEDLFTVTAKSKGSLRSGTDFRAGRRAGNVFCEIGRPRGFSKRTKLLIAFAVVVVVIVIICLVVAISAIGKNGSSSNADDPAAVKPSKFTTTAEETPMQSSTASTKTTMKPESTSNPVPAESGEWTPWKSWTACSVTCGSGVQERYRTCNKIDPTYTDCDGENVQQAGCTADACPEWTPWESWTACSVTCGSGMQERYRTCNKIEPTDTDCDGDNVQQAECTVDGCPQAEWSPWDSWTACSVTCGSGVQERYRTCNKIEPTDTDCDGENVQQAGCTADACPEWTTWESWTACSVTCGSGVQERYRTCNKIEPTDTDCDGDNVQQAECTADACPEWTPWESWTACSVTCGSGVQERYRTCNKIEPTDTDCDGDNVQQAECTVDGCPQAEWSPWESWTACSVTCGSGVQERYRTCIKIEPTDTHCDGENVQQAECTVDGCPQAEWSSWEAWTACSVTCGSGVHVRYRACNKIDSTEADCEGQYVQPAVCTVDECPVYGKWTTWTRWESCGVTCGGGIRTRSRQCNKVSSSDIDCYGDTTQQTSCNEWGCPDCGKTCAVGRLNEACDTCVCESSNIQGRILSTTGNPVSYAALAEQSAPLRVIAESNSTGFFSLNETCNTSTVIVSRDGFQDAVVEITDAYQTIYMELEVLPRIIEQPQSKYRISGEDVLFCCSAVSAPAITYYEWFHNSVLLDKALYVNNGTRLSMTNVQPTDSGEYTCRANNAARAILSNPATLSVKDNEDDFCEDALQQKQINLPESCAQPGRNTTLYEVGDCASKTCRQASANAIEQCSDSSKSCCIPSRVETKSINCTGYELELIVVKACSCGSCDTAVSVQVSGKVVSAKARSPVEYAEVWLNGELETYTSYTGSFYVTVTDSIDKAVFTVKDTYNNMYLDTTKVVEISAGVGGTISVTIQMLEMSAPVIIDPTVETVLSMDRVQNESSSPVALLKVPANSFYRNDGSAYTGMVSSIVTFIDPTDDNIQDAVPGVFQFIDEEGTTIDLESKGIFNLQFQDENGEALFVDGIIEVSFPDQAASDFTLWKLNTVSGLWEPLTPSIQTDRRKRRQAEYVIGEIDMSTLTVRTYCNIDRRFYRSSGSPCYFKTRLYKDESFSEQIKNDNAK